MRYIDFYNAFNKYPIVFFSDIRNIFPDFDHRRFYEWQKKGYIKKIINNCYLFTKKKLSDNDKNFIANKLYGPSYLSLEYALGFYSLIPETVYWHTSVTTKRTRQFKTPIGNFSYRKVKNNLFFGYKIIEIDKVAFKIAEPEKAILDFLYLRKDINNEKDLYELRLNYDNWQNLISIKKMKEYAKRYSSRKMDEKLALLLNLMKK